MGRWVDRWMTWKEGKVVNYINCENIHHPLPSMYIHLQLSIHIYRHLYTPIYIHPSIYIYQLSIYIHPSIYINYLSISIHLSIHPFIYTHHRCAGDVYGYHASRGSRSLSPGRHRSPSHSGKYALMSAYG
jgi:hypothetical protein